jgi:hypothetical protein
VPNTFISGTTILASAVNANFDAVEAQALNRAGGTMTGNLIFSPDNTYDLGASGATRPRDVHVSRKIYTYDLTLTNDLQGVTATFSGAVTAGGLTFSSGSISGLTNVTASGTITSGEFSGGGASLTGIVETAITDGAVLARVAADETISGGWTFTKAAAPITVQAGAGTSAFQAVTGTTGVFSSTVEAGGAGFTGGGANITGIVESAITDGAVLADGSTGNAYAPIGIALQTVSATYPVDVVTNGEVVCVTGAAEGSEVYPKDGTAGAPTHTAATKKWSVGVATGATTVLVRPIYVA